MSARENSAYSRKLRIRKVWRCKTEERINAVGGRECVPKSVFITISHVSWTQIATVTS